MSKKIRVAWEDLQPGDLIHVKGSTNVYQFIRFTGLRRKAPGFSHGDIRRFVFFWCLGVYRLSGFN